MEQEKAKKILKELNGGKLQGDWEDSSGHHVMLAVNKDPLQGVKFDSNSGLVVKNFINRKTGEVKTYWLGGLKG